MKHIYFNKSYFCILFFVFGTLTGTLDAQNSIRQQQAERWADSVYQSLTLEQRIGQLIITRANNPNAPYDTKIENWIKKYDLGGVSFLAGDPVKQALQINQWNKRARTPLFVAMDAEWGLGMRLKGTVSYPYQMTLGAVSDDSLLFQMGKQIAQQCRRMGIQINFAPVVDVNTNPLNPVIGMRSFGENPDSVANKALWYMKGMEENGLIACAKHFPGHGNTFQDSHKTLPVITDSKTEIEKTALLPYRVLFKSQPPVDAVMVAHLSVPALEHRKHFPSSLSYPVVTGLLKDKMHFKGLIITDALDMKGVSLQFNHGDAALKAFLAGNDILLTPNDIPEAVAKIKTEVLKNEKAAQRLKESCKKVLYYKYLSGAAARKPVDTLHLISDLNRPDFHHTANQLFYHAITVIKNDSNLLPFQDTVPASTAIVIVGDNHAGTFEPVFRQYFPAKVYYLKKNASSVDKNFVLKQLPKFDRAVFCVVKTNSSAARHFGISSDEIAFLTAAAQKTKTVLNLFASPYALNLFHNPAIFQAIVVSYQDTWQTQKASAEVITGTRKASGHLPVTAGHFVAGTGMTFPKIRLRYGTPQEVGADTTVLHEVDSIALAGINMHAYPGCQILAAKNGIIFYHKAFGYQTYADTVPENMHFMYDLASLTKILATTVALIKQQEDSIINVNNKLSAYLPMLLYSNKKDLGMKEILSHQAGLEDWIPFYLSTLKLHLPEKSIPTTNVLHWIKVVLGKKNPDSVGPDTTIYHHKISELYTVRVAQNLYLQKDYHYHMMQQILDSPLGEKKYQYSGLGFYLFKAMTERLNEMPFDQYLYKKIYHRMGLYRLVFTPRRYFPYTQTNPTEHDTVWRMQQIWGDVHDMGAAMLGGVSGNAGLFGDAHDVAALMQMLMDYGRYDGKQILDSATICLFNHRYFAADSNRRGLGFDKPLLRYEDHKSNCKSASDESFGHSGFTGTYTWADPKNGLVYVFLSNRVFPDMNNDKLAKEDIRTNIHQVFYNAFLKKPVPLVKETDVP